MAQLLDCWRPENISCFFPSSLEGAHPIVISWNNIAVSKLSWSKRYASWSRAVGGTNDMIGRASGVGDQKGDTESLAFSDRRNQEGEKKKKEKRGMRWRPRYAARPTVKI